MKIRLGVLLLFADDFPAMHAFYRDTLGLPERKDVDPGPPYEVGRNWAQFETGAGDILEVFDRAVHGPELDLPEPRRNAIVVTFRVDDLDEAATRLRHAQVEFASELKEQEWGSYLYIRDPEGNLLQLYRSQEVNPG